MAGQDTKFCWECELVSRNTKTEVVKKNLGMPSFNNGQKMTEDGKDETL